MTATRHAITSGLREASSTVLMSLADFNTKCFAAGTPLLTPEGSKYSRGFPGWRSVFVPR